MLKQKRNASRREDIFNYLLTAQKPETGEPFPDPELFGEAIILFVAGSDTTSTALLTTLWHLISHKETYKTLAEEVRSKFSSIDEITYQEAQHLPYLRAVIEEGLRIFPPNSGFIPRQVIDSPRPFTLHNVVIPPGVSAWFATVTSASKLTDSNPRRKWVFPTCHCTEILCTSRNQTNLSRNAGSVVGDLREIRLRSLRFQKVQGLAWEERESMFRDAFMKFVLTP